jgi:hypothetical protein
MGNQRHSKLINQLTNQPVNYHTPVLLNEAVEGLNIKPDGIYVDCTFGGGGHSHAVLQFRKTLGTCSVFYGCIKLLRLMVSLPTLAYPATSLMKLKGDFPFALMLH